MASFTPVASLSGGILIGLAAALLLLGRGKLAGISGILSGATFPRQGEWGWRVLFLSGLVLGGLLFARLMPGAIAPPHGRSLPWIAIGGLLVGVGTRLGGGCTSGHGVCGLALRSKRSLVATVTFIGSGVLTVWAMRLIGGAS